MQNKRAIGMISFISLIIGVLLLFTFIFPDKFFIALPLGLILLALSFVLSLFSRKDKFGKVSLYAFPIITFVYLLFFGFMYLFWNTP